MLRTHVAILGSIVAATFVILTPATAGTTGGLTGYVYGRADQPLSGATIGIIPLTSKNESRFDIQGAPIDTTVSNSAGFFSMLSLPPGYYLVYARLKGFHFYCPTRVAIDADQADAIRLRLTDRRLFVRCARQRIVSSQSTATAYSFDEAGDWETP